MSLTERLMKLGAWDVTLEGADPEDFDYFEHVVFTRSRVDPDALGDAGMLSASAYTGVIRHRKHAPVASGTREGKLTLSGVGLEAWLADEDDKGFIFETAREYSGDTFANVLDRSGSAPYGLLRDDAGAQTAIQSGTIHSVAGTYDGTHHYQSQRYAIQYVCDVFDAEYRVNPDGTLDAGTEAQLFTTTPTAIIAKESGDDPSLEGVVGDLATDLDIDDYTTRVVLLASGEGESVATGSADAASVPYKDLHGNDVVRTRIVNESETSSTNAAARAQLQLNRFSSARQALTLTASDYEIDGSFDVGDTIWVYDPDQGLTDTDNEVQFRGRTLNPVAIRVLGITQPVKRGMGVYHRDKDGAWEDLTDLVVWSNGSSTIEVGANPRKLTSSSASQVISGRVNSPASADSATPAAPAHANTPWGTSSYVDGEGRTRAQIVVEWSLPLNTDGSTITDGSHYMVRWRRNGETEYQTSAAAWGSTAFLLQDLSPGITYEISIAAYDLAGNSAGYAANSSVVASADTVAPSTPAAPTLAANPLKLQVSHDLGKASGGTFNLEADLDHLNVYASTSSGFTPAEANRIGQIPATQAHLSLGITVIGSFDITDATARFVKVTAVDGAGNESTPSAQASASATLIDTAHINDASITTAKINDLAVTTAKITDLAVTTGKITDLAVTTAKITDLAVTTAKITDLAVTNAKITSLGVDKLTAGTITSKGIVVTGAGGYLRSGNYVLNTSGFNLDANTGSAEFNNVTVRGTIYATAGEIGGLTVTGNLTFGTGGVLRTAASGQRIQISTSDKNYIYFYSGAGGETSPASIQVRDDDGTGEPDLWFQGPTTATGSSSLRLRTVGAIITGGLNINTGGLSVTAGGVTINSGTAGGPSFRFSADTDTGMYLASDGVLAFATGGVLRGSFQADGIYATTPNTSGAAANLVTAGSAHNNFQRSTSALKYKSRVTTKVDYLADIDLIPTKHWRKDDKRWRYGLIADWLGDQDTLLGVYEDGEIDNYDDRAVLAILAAKVNRLEEAVHAA